MNNSDIIQLLDCDQQIRTLGFYQPYAGLMFSANKIETRWVRKGKRPPFPLGWYALYSTKKAYKNEELKFVAGPAYSDIQEERVSNPNLFELTSCIVGIAKLVNVDTAENNAEAHIFSRTFVDIYQTDEEFTRWLLFFEEQFLLKEHIPFKGKQGVGFLTYEQRYQIMHHYL